MEKVVIFGSLNLATTCHYYLTHDSPYEVVAFTVDGSHIKEETLCGLPVVPFENIESLFPPAQYKMIIPLAYREMNKLRARKYYEAKAKGYDLVNYISSRASVWPDLVVGDNCFICEGVTIQPYVKIGSNVVISSRTTVGHHSNIQDHCFLGAHVIVLGGVTVEPYCFIGTNATIGNDITLRSESLIGATSLITRNIQVKGVYMADATKQVQKSSDELGKLLEWLLR
jgi:sugar O-acyltransferase (sialic acid O-acetyltransferase NeuD family)